MKISDQRNSMSCLSTACKPSEAEVIQLIMCIPELKGIRHDESERLLLKILLIEVRRDAANAACKEIQAILNSRQRVKNTEKLIADLAKFNRMEKRCDRALTKVGTALNFLIRRPMFPKGVAMKFTKAARKGMNNSKSNKSRKQH